METFCTTSRHSKYRPTLNANSFYQPSTYSRNYRQNEYGFANSTRNSALLWHERPHPPPKKSKGKLCSIALAATAFIVLVAVLSIAGLALYMGALRTEPANPLSTYTCSAKIARGDRFISNLPEKARRYRLLFESLYQRSILGPSIVSCNVEKFGNDSLTVYFKVTLNRRKVPRHIYNIEKSLKDILLGDALSRKPVFRNVRFDPRSISIKQTADTESYQRVITKPKELPKPTPNLTVTVTADQHVKKKPVIEEVDVKEEDLPVIQGSFKISKTEADITEKKGNGNVGSVEISTLKPKTTTSTKTPKRPTLKETSITSALFKLGSSDRNVKKTSTERITTITLEDLEPTKNIQNQKNNDPNLEILKTTSISANLNFDQPTGLQVDKLFNQPIGDLFNQPDNLYQQSNGGVKADTMDTSSSIPSIRFSYPTTPKVENKFSNPSVGNFEFSNPSTLKIDTFNTQSTNSNFKFSNPSTPKIDIFNTPTENSDSKLINPSTPKLESFNPVLFSVGPNVFNQEPWVPLYHMPETRSEETPKLQQPIYTQNNDYESKPQQPLFTQNFDYESKSQPQQPIHAQKFDFESNPQQQQPIFPQNFDYKPKPQPQQPIYTSFTNPGLSFHSFDSEKIGSTSLKGHPIPVNKIAELTEPSIWETTARTYNSEEIDQIQFTTSEPPTEGSEDDLYDLHTSDGNYEDTPGFIEVETLKYVPGSSNGSEKVESERAEANSFEKTYNDTLQAVMVTDRTNNYQLKQSAVLKNISSIFHSLASSLGIAPIHFNNLKKNQTEASSTSTTITTTPSTTTEEVIKAASNIGQGLAEVVDADELSLMMQTTKAPLVTLLPVKSNSGVGRPIRPRPKPKEDSISENRSFPSGSSKLNLNDYTNPIKYIETEVVTSVSSEEHKVKLNKSQLDNFKVVGVLNFESELPATSAPLVAEPLTVTTTTKGTPQVFSDEVAVLSMNSSSRVDSDGFEYLTPEKLKQLSEISKLSDNSTNGEDDGVISTKAVSSSYTINHSGFKILTKTFNKIPTSLKDEEKKASSGSYNSFFLDVNNKSDCSNFTVKCGDGQCLPDTTRCNQLVDCNDGSDEKNCNCADYLRSQFLLRKICDGIVDCWDFSDENHCEWCKPGQYVCGNSKVCINRASICDGVRDCPHGDDERQCVTVAPTLNAADEFPYHSEGYLMVRKHGKWGKLCVDNFERVVAKSQTSWEISDLGQAVCKAMTYQSLDNVKILTESKKKSINRNSRYFELTYSFQNETKSSLTFENTTCKSGEVVRVKCQSLECGARPQATKQVARIVGGGNAGLGAWPWQAALYKEGEFQCGATLISDKWLLSAGHCFYHSLEEHWVARLGALRRGTALPSPYEQLRPIVQIILHPGYVDAGFINDISLLKMEVPVIFSDYVRPICLPQAGVPPKDGRICTVVGWGQLFEIGRIFPDTLQEVQIPVISTAECRKRTLFLPLYRVTDDMFCAGYDRGGRDACLGDSGGPLMCPESDGRWVLHGITSNGYGCARAYRPGVYTKVSNYINWINPYIYNDNVTITPIRNTCTGHRCPLGECLPKSRLCNGFIECSDGSDEFGCISN